MAPASVAYGLLMQPRLRQLRERAVKAFRPLVALDEERFWVTLASAPLFDRRREWLAVSVGAVVGVLVTSEAWPYYQFWATLYVGLASAIMFGVLGWLVYSTLAGTRILRGPTTRIADSNVFEMGLLEPIGRWSLGVALSFVGGITLSLIFLPQPALTVATAIMYVVLSLAPVLVFFLNMVSARRIMVEAKRQELKMVRSKMAAASRALSEKTGDDPDEMMSLLANFAALVAVEQRVKNVPEWPYTATIRRSLAVSLLLPIAVGIGQSLLTQVVLTLLE
jgi:hypothetical protein